MNISVVRSLSRALALVEVTRSIHGILVKTENLGKHKHSCLLESFLEITSTCLDKLGIVVGSL